MTRAVKTIAWVLLAWLATPVAFAQDLASAEAVYAPGNGVSLPRVTKHVFVQYSADALRRKIRGAIKLKCVVSSAGKTRDVELVSGLEPDMDAKAIAALKQWEFEPGRLGDGTPVSVRITVDMTFTIR
jgi:TonB family protein